MMQTHLSELVNRDEALFEKNLYFHKIFNGLQLFAERRSEGYKIGDQTKWDKEFENDKYKCTIQFNDPRKVVTGVPDYEFCVEIDNRKMFADVKKRISEMVFDGRNF